MECLFYLMVIEMCKEIIISRYYQQKEGILDDVLYIYNIILAKVEEEKIK